MPVSELYEASREYQLALEYARTARDKSGSHAISFAEELVQVAEAVAGARQRLWRAWAAGWEEQRGETEAPL